MKINFGWEDDSIAAISIIRCDCGFILHDGFLEGEIVNQNREMIAHDGEIWTCPKCGRNVRFKWLGMTFEVV